MDDPGVDIGQTTATSAVDPNAVSQIRLEELWTNQAGTLTPALSPIPRTTRNTSAAVSEARWRVRSFASEGGLKANERNISLSVLLVLQSSVLEQLDVDMTLLTANDISEFNDIH